MGYTFVIGNAVPKFHKEDFPEVLYAAWDVEDAFSPDAPTFTNDGLTENSNSRSPSYGVWFEFCQNVGIVDLFFDNGHLIGGHPGTLCLTPEIGDRVSKALVEYRNVATLPPGFEGYEYRGPQRYNFNLARLIWLDWWIQWALNNCETPAISNT